MVGLILARHQLQDGRADGEGIEHTVETVRAHVDKIREVSGSNHHVGIGSDLDGFIKPTMSGVESAEDLAKLEQALRVAYPDDADAILSGNALRVVSRVLAQRGRLSRRVVAGHHAGQPRSNRGSHRFDVGSQAVVARHLHDRAKGALRRHAERVSRTLHDQRRHLHLIELG